MGRGADPRSVAGCERFPLPPPSTRRLRIYAFDPMRGRDLGNRAEIEVPYEVMQGPGPWGQRVRVVDHDLTRGVYHPALDLDDPRVLGRGGLEPDESDPRFHQQMVYAVAMKTIELFERSLGRRLSLRRRKRRNGGWESHPLLILPHAFEGANAYYDPNSHAVLFGYFRADPTDPGPNLPGQWVFTCLSHDIVVHEVTHALLHRLRKHFLDATNPDVLALHEGLADIVAVFQHFTYQDVVADAIRRSPQEFSARSGLASLADQFGYARGQGRALRTAYVEPDVRLGEVSEPHERGGVLVAAVFDAYFELYERRTRDLLRVATQGTGRLAPGEASTDLSAMLAATASTTAKQLLSMCIRAVEYMPPVDPTFGDFLRALVTADVMLAPVDTDGRRGILVNAFRRRGILPDGVGSLAEESLVLPAPEGELRFDAAGLGTFAELMQAAASRVDGDEDDEPDAGAEAEETDEAGEAPGPGAEGACRADKGGRRGRRRLSVGGRMAALLTCFAEAHREALLLGPEPVRPVGLHAGFRVGQDGQLVVELIAQLVQKRAGDDPALGGLVYRGGTTLVIGADGAVRAMAAKPLGAAGPAAAPGAPEAVEPRRQALRQHVAQLDARDPASPYRAAGAHRVRMQARGSLAGLHGAERGLA